MIVRPRTDDDVEPLVAITEEIYVTDGYPALLPTSFRDFLVDPQAHAAWVADDAGTVVGHVALHRRSSAPVMALAVEATGQPVDRVAVVARLFVGRAGRRRGVGRMLLDTAAAAALQRGLWPVLDVAVSLAAAVDLYGAAGWTRAGEVTAHFEMGSIDEFVYLGPRPPTR